VGWRKHEWYWDGNNEDGGNENKEEIQKKKEH
jgi:hypothetical protein